jgi:hypothetical protein
MLIDDGKKKGFVMISSGSRTRMKTRKNEGKSFAREGGNQGYPSDVNNTYYTCHREIGL